MISTITQVSQGNALSFWTNFDISKLRNAGHKLQFVEPQQGHYITYSKIEIVGIDPEILFWESLVVCYVLGASPLLPVLVGFLNHISNKFLIDKIVMLKNRVTLLWFESIDTYNKVLMQRVYQFDKKPLIVKPWHKDYQRRRSKGWPFGYNCQILT